MTIIQVYAPTTTSKEADAEWFYEDLQDLRELTPKTNNERCHFHHRGLECKIRKSRDTWSKRQVWPWSTKLSRAKANRVLPREHTGRSKHPLQQHRRRKKGMSIIKQHIITFQTLIITYDN